MSDIVYTKHQINSRKSKGMAFELHPDMMREISKHLEVMHTKQDEERWAALFVDIVICESDAWHNQIDIADELPKFLKAVRQGAVKVYSGSVGAYAEAYREWKVPTRAANFAQDSTNGAGTAHEYYSIPTAISGENYAPEWEQCFERDSFGNARQKKRCLRDVLEGIESGMIDGMIARGSETDKALRERYRTAERLWESLTGTKWVRLANGNQRQQNAFMEAM